MKIEESEKNMKHEWFLLDPMFDLFEQIKEGVELSEDANIPILGGKAVNIVYLLIFRIGGTEKSYEQWEDMQVGLKIWKAFNHNF